MLKMTKKNIINCILYIGCIFIFLNCMNVPAVEYDKNTKQNIITYQNLQIVSNFDNNILPEKGREFFLKATIKSIIDTIGSLVRSEPVFSIPLINNYKTYLKFRNSGEKTEIICDIHDQYNVWKYAVTLDKDLEINEVLKIHPSSRSNENVVAEKYTEFPYSPSPANFAYPGDVYIFNIGDKVFIKSGKNTVLSNEDINKVIREAPADHPIKKMDEAAFDLESIRNNNKLTVLEKFMFSNVPVRKKIDMSDIGSGRLKYFYFQDVLEVENEKFPVNYLIYRAARLLKDLETKYGHKVIQSYVIGSYGWGNYTESCDFDLCIITEKSIENIRGLKDYFSAQTGISLEVHNYNEEEFKSALKLVNEAKELNEDENGIREYLNEKVREDTSRSMRSIHLARVIAGEKVGLITDDYNVTRSIEERKQPKDMSGEEAIDIMDTEISELEKLRLKILIEIINDKHSPKIDVDEFLSLFSRFYLLSDNDFLELLENYIFMLKINNENNEMGEEGISKEKTLFMAALKLFAEKKDISYEGEQAYQDLSTIADCFLPYINSDPRFLLTIMGSLFEKKHLKRVDRGFTLNFSETQFLKNNIQKVVDNSKGTITIVKYGANYSIDGIMSVVKDMLSYLTVEKSDEQFEIKIICVDNKYNNLLNISKQLDSLVKNNQTDIPMGYNVIYGDITDKAHNDVLLDIGGVDIALLRFDEQMAVLNKKDQDKVLSKVREKLNDEGLMFFKEQINGREITQSKEMDMRDNKSLGSVVEEVSKVGEKEELSGQEILDKIRIARELSQSHKREFMRDVSNEPGLVKNLLEVIASSIVYDNLVLVLDEDMVGSFKNDIVRIMKEVKDQFGQERIKLIFSRSDKIDDAIKDYTGIANYKVFVFSENENIQPEQNNVFVSLIKKEDILYEYYFPIFEIITITLAEYLDSGSYEMVPSDIKKRNILSINKINNKLIFELLPEPEKLDKGKLLSEFKALRQALKSL